LVSLREEFESTFDGQVFKLENSQLQRIYDFQKGDAALVFLRKGVGILYPADGRDSPEEIFEFFNDNREPIVKELDDNNFEHLTQASTGSTTGDWLVQFYDNQCIDCNRLTATWETVGAKLKMRMNVARVNRLTKGIQTAKRFKVQNAPEFILVRQGKYYRFNLKKYDVESFVGFATSWFNRVAAEKVVAPETPFENLVNFTVLKLKELSKMPILNENLLPIAIGIPLLLLVLIFMCRRKAAPAPQKKSSSKKD
jgi:Thioredoxin